MFKHLALITHSIRRTKVNNRKIPCPRPGGSRTRPVINGSILVYDYGAAPPPRNLIVVLLIRNYRSISSSQPGRIHGKKRSSPHQRKRAFNQVILGFFYPFFSAFEDLCVVCEVLEVALFSYPFFLRPVGERRYSLQISTHTALARVGITRSPHVSVCVCALMKL